MSIPINQNATAGEYVSSGGVFRLPAENDRRRACVADLMMGVAKSFPKAIALSSGADALTYKELATQAAQLASYLITLGAGRDVPVAVCLERSFDFVVSALAVMLSGAAYLPLDPAWPAARLREILKDAQAPLLISRGLLAARVAESGTHVIDLDSAAGSIERCDSVASGRSSNARQSGLHHLHLGIHRISPRASRSRTAIF